MNYDRGYSGKNIWDETDRVIEALGEIGVTLYI